MKRLAVLARRAARLAGAAPRAAPTPYVVTLVEPDASVDAVGRGAPPARRPSCAPLRRALERLRRRPQRAAGRRPARRPGASPPSSPTPRSARDGMRGAGRGGDRSRPAIRRGGGATPLLAHQPATTARRGARHGRRPRQPGPRRGHRHQLRQARHGRPGRQRPRHQRRRASSPRATAARASSASRPGTRVYAVKVLNNRAVGTLSSSCAASTGSTANAAALNIRVANMSIGGVGRRRRRCGNKSTGDSEHKAICAATAAGVTFVVSAGNSGVDFETTVPAAYREVLTATAITDTDGLPGALGPASCAKKELDDRTGTYSNFAVSAAAAAHASPRPAPASSPRASAARRRPTPARARPRRTSRAPSRCAIGSGGLPGPCAGLAPAGVIARVRADATVAGRSRAASSATRCARWRARSSGRWSPPRSTEAASPAPGPTRLRRHAEDRHPARRRDRPRGARRRRCACSTPSPRPRLRGARVRRRERSTPTAPR